MKRVSTGPEFEKAMLMANDMLQDDLTIILKKISSDAFRMLVQLSAKDTGYLRHNWAVSVGAVVPHEPSRGDRKKKYPDAKMPILNIEHDSIIVLYNNAEYAIYLENGTPKMRAQPMIEPTKMAVSNQLNQASKMLSRKYYHV